MPVLPFEVVEFVTRVRDNLTMPFQRSDSTLRASRAQVSLPGVATFVVDEPGAAGNAWTVTVTVPGGTSGIVVTPSGTDVTIALAVSAGVATAANTGAAIAAAWNAAVTGATAYFIGAGTATRTTALSATSFDGGADSDRNGVGLAPTQYLRAQDLSTVLELFQRALNQTANLTATGGSATTVVDGGGTFVAGQQVGNYVTFAGNTTAALAGVQARVISNTATTLTFAADALPAAPAAGDTYTIQGGIFADAIEVLREGQGLGDSPRGNVYGDNRLVTDALIRGIRQLGGTVAERTVFSGTTAAGSTTTLIQLNTRGAELRVDELRGLKLTVTGSAPQLITRNYEGSVEVPRALSGGAPTGGVAFTVTVPSDSASFRLGRDVHPGAHQSGNDLASLLGQLQTRVVAYTLPT